jgi:hypothetical protein
MNLEERRDIRQELSKLGFKGDYLDGWQPRANCWRHRPQLNVDGDEIAPAGKYVPNQPGDPYTTVRLARNAVLPWPRLVTVCDKCGGRVDRREAAGSPGNGP